ncbi:MAG: cell wall hydrolase [Lachnospiraceae bacterium]|nr:cell wall hydrolase [Lachnospiraceae bacterium]
MEAWKNTGRRSAVFFVLVLMMILMMPGRASAAWEKNTDGTYSWYQNGKLKKNSWVSGTYYVNARGIRSTGLTKIGKRYYYFGKSGAVIRNSWIRADGKLYYATKNGPLVVGCRRQIDDAWYAFGKTGEQLKGKRTFSGRTYYFGLKTGKMLTDQWVKENKQYYYYGENGVLAKNCWVGCYYVGKTGTRMKNTWKDNCYLLSSGKAATGLVKVGSYLYYFDPKTYKKQTGTRVTVKGVTYELNQKGQARKVSGGDSGDSGSTTPPKTNIKVESTYYSDKYVDDETLLAALIYCEAGNQSYTGKLGVGLVIMNRMKSSRFPSKLREVVYQNHQFAPARDGALTRALNKPSLVNADCKKAAAEVMNRLKNYKKGTSTRLTIGGKQVAFSYLYFMTQNAYRSLGLSATYRKIGSHVFFARWA